MLKELPLLVLCINFHKFSGFLFFKTLRLYVFCAGGYGQTRSEDDPKGRLWCLQQAHRWTGITVWWTKYFSVSVYRKVFADFCTDRLFPYFLRDAFTRFLPYNTYLVRKFTENIYHVFIKQIGHSWTTQNDFLLAFLPHAYCKKKKLLCRHCSGSGPFSNEKLTKIKFIEEFLPTVTFLWIVDET